MAYSKGVSGTLSDYTHLRTLPALLSVVFVIAGLYQFGGISDVTITWLSNYTLTSTHAMGASIGAYALAFASSETKQFDNYQDFEKVLIAAGPAVILGYEYIQPVTDLINTTSNAGPIAAFVVTVVAWGVAVR
ncbi:VP3 [Halorubrum pleomorphic virus 1]|uniref:Matrix protein n=1 Tax=Halorubrum pleomorphic virus 1 TaxID=634168 RepID=MATRX_HAPV1|nr:VP3 [Halorubrum pleomorphic virus 1]C1JJY2.1 RecName: Full=Matrix protein; Short=Mtrx; AltName: Full=Virion protein 3; Short=VP3 [Halorubrum pleomorphic virus 1]ACO54898.1 VP3 [Halorubrum pleomorphic virus 1]